MAERPPWRRADLALGMLVVLALLAIFCALSVSERGLEALLALAVTLCKRTFDEALVHGADLGRLSFLLSGALGLLLATAEVLRLALATRRWMAWLATAQRAPTGRLHYLARRCGLAEATVLVRSSRPVVFTHGLLRPKVWLTTGLVNALANDELEAVLRHEAHHRKMRDPLKVLLVRCLSRALFFIPVARDLSAAYCVAKEVAADRQAVQAMGSALPLARALRKLIAAPIAPPLEAALVGDQGATEQRLLALLNPAAPLPLFLARRLGMSFLWLLILLAVAFSPDAGHSPSFTECAAVSWASAGL